MKKVQLGTGVVVEVLSEPAFDPHRQHHVALVRENADSRLYTASLEGAIEVRRVTTSIAPDDTGERTVDENTP